MISYTNLKNQKTYKGKSNNWTVDKKANEMKAHMM